MWAIFGQYFATLCWMTGTAAEILKNRRCLVRAVALITEAAFCSVRVWGHVTEQQFMYAHITCTFGGLFLYHDIFLVNGGLTLEQ